MISWHFLGRLPFETGQPIFSKYQIAFFVFFPAGVSTVTLLLPFQTSSSLPIQNYKFCKSKNIKGHCPKKLKNELLVYLNPLSHTKKSKVAFGIKTYFACLHLCVREPDT